MKSLEDILVKVVGGILTDYFLAYPSTRGLIRDYMRVTHNVKNRGIGFFTLDLPSLDALLTRGLADGRLTLSGPCSHAVSKKVLVPRLFSGLWLRIFDKSGSLRDEPCIDSILFLRQLCCLGKKLELPCSKGRVSLCIKEYFDVENECRSPSLNWDGDELILRGHGHGLHFRDGLAVRDPDLFGSCQNDSERGTDLAGILSNLEHVCALGSRTFGSPDVYSLTGSDSGRALGLSHGPGSVSDLNYRRETKYSFYNYPDKLDRFFPHDAFGALNASNAGDYRNHELPSKLMSVPKTAKGPRLIASEPSSNMWCQRIVAGLFSKFFQSFRGDFVTLDNQMKSRVLVEQASLDGSLATIDLSSASDRLSCWTIERAFRGNILMLSLLHSVRTRWTVDMVSDSKSYLRLKKYSTQGSALTFPIQSYIFLMCCLAVMPRQRTLEEYRQKYGKSVRVFGDDIIVPNDRYADLTALLTYLGLKVNDQKSFSSGYFRESCGLDAYKGYNVTPVKPKQLVPTDPSSISSLRDFSNNLHKAGFWNAASAALSSLPRFVLRLSPVVDMEAGLPGIASFCGKDSRHLDKRWNEHLHRFEVRVLSFTDKARRKYTGGVEGIFQYVIERPSPETKWVHGINPRAQTVMSKQWAPLQ
jgi:hypothetical protein